MRLSAIALACLLMTTAGSLVTEPTDDDPPVSDPTCTDLTEGEVVVRNVPFVTEFLPTCLVVENGAEVTWQNDGDVDHDPGDGEEDRRALCFRAAVDRGAPMGPDETYTIRLAFDEEDQQLRSFHEERGWLDCHDAVWTFTDDEEDAIRIPYRCHIHHDSEAAIVLDLG